MHGSYIINKDDCFELWKCSDCDCIFISNINIDKQYYEKYYADDYYSNTRDFGFINNAWSFIYRLFFNRKERIISSYFRRGKEKLSILDIGCGDGKFLLSLNNKRFEKNGAEINPQGVVICREKGINIYDQDICSTDFGEKKFDVVSLWHVIEHLENPSLIFKKIKEILKNDGILIFQIPNNKSLGFKFGKENWFHLDSPRHLNIPNKKTIWKVCEKNELKIIDIKNEFYDYPLDLFWSIRKSKMRFLMYPLYPFFKFFSREHLTYVINKKDEKLK